MAMWVQEIRVIVLCWTLMISTAVRTMEGYYSTAGRGYGASAHRYGYTYEDEGEDQEPRAVAAFRRQPAADLDQDPDLRFYKAPDVTKHDYYFHYQPELDLGGGYGPYHRDAGYGQQSRHSVLDFGATGNGRTDDSQAFASAWKATCEDGSGQVTMMVPSGYTFLLSPTRFNGPCNSADITIQILGNIAAPSRSNWGSDKDEWLYFYKVNGLKVIGNRQAYIHGNGNSWWKHGGTQRPTSMRFESCNRLHLSGLVSRNSPRNHISISNSKHVHIGNLQIYAPSTSPNTDGIDISTSNNVTIRDSFIGTGDDCVAINGGTVHVKILGTHCGPGHGISVGSLGRDGEYDVVEDVLVHNCTFQSTQNGVRIKTWQGGSGYARHITFSDITFIESDHPVIIDQYYCPHKTCGSQASAVKISDVTYAGLRGTSSSQDGTINFSCSESVPCTHIRMEDVRIEPLYDTHKPSQCINAFGTATTTDPALNCLQNHQL